MARRPPVTRRSRITGHRYTVGHGDDMGLDTEGEDRWYSVCEYHGTLCVHRTRRLADFHGPVMDWCEDCHPEATS